MAFVTLSFDPKPVIASAIARGLIKPAPAVVVADPKHLAYVQGERGQFLANGLNANGEPRQYQKHPDLAQFLHNREEYHRAYMRKLRGKPL